MIPSDAGTYCIDRFVKNASKLVKPSDKILDAGAGDCPYRHYFNSSNYHSMDIKGNDHTFLGNLEHIPVLDKTYDIILCTQVLEHVPYPQKVINEFYRILKPGGKLFLTAPQGWKLHGEPNHYFNFTKYGLALLFNDAGLSLVSIETQGGMFWYFNDCIRDLPLPFIKQFIQLFLFNLDKFDKNQKFTLGYNCYCIKEVKND